MKKRQLEIALQHVPQLQNPLPHLEQYMTPATIAADIVFTAYQYGDIAEKTVLDLGCGTGIFSVGAFLLGATKTIGIDVDKTSIQIAQTYSQEHNYVIEYLVSDIEDIDITGDTVLMNPPFGAQKSNQQADRKFLKKAIEVSQVTYSLHLKKTFPFLQTLLRALDAEITYQKEYTFPISHQFSFHTKEQVTYDVILLRIQSPKL